jgi:hypothetical protein
MTEIAVRRIIGYVVIKNLTLSLLWKAVGAEGGTLTVITTILDVFFCLLVLRPRYAGT